jgi:hypothetical protein
MRPIGRIVTCATISVAAAYAADAQVPSDEQIAAQFVPPGFAAFVANNPRVAGTPSWQTLSADLDGTNRSDYLAVAYGNGHIAYVRIIKKDTVPKLVGETVAEAARDIGPRLSTTDLDGDGKPEFRIDCINGNRGATLS